MKTGGQLKLSLSAKKIATTAKVLTRLNFINEIWLQLVNVSQEQEKV